MQNVYSPRVRVYWTWPSRFVPGVPLGAEGSLSAYHPAYEPIVH